MYNPPKRVLFRSMGSAAAVGRVAEGRERNGHVVVRRVAHLEDHLDKGVETLQSSSREVGSGFVDEFVNAAVIGLGGHRQEIADPSVGIGTAFGHRGPGAVGREAFQTDGHPGSRRPGRDVEDMARELMSVLRAEGARCRAQHDQQREKILFHHLGSI